jgi:hypothetical protein
VQECGGIGARLLAKAHKTSQTLQTEGVTAKIRP